ncbi:MAG: hypothetical protein AVDCRST_MAG30-2643 [uncultured Solirubrobacteraceae bacterium]|uniref:Two-component transcriptional response regulator, LuxR family n=1 Tax=uncultured Solirubrobacteraceae bacterium TaxID=1162706 RepID=A0A6J4T5H5_9ACTN|nr:MAG: hypothetical protein AVDCRST_MAG30-2643 [uncultured Solirubrobacteraceae bacterium]
MTDYDDALGSDVPTGPGGAPLRVLIAEDHRMFRQGLRELFEEFGIQVIGEAADGEAAVRLAGELRPDVVIMDLQMPKLRGIDATKRISHELPQIKVLVLTMSLTDDDAVEAMIAGAAGYLLKDADVDEIMRALRSVMAGDTALAPAVAARLMDRLRSRESDAAAGEVQETPVELTPRELEVLTLLATGHDNSDIAKDLFVSVSTVKAHVGAILEKLGVDNRVQAAVAAVRQGLVQPPS